VFFISVAPGGFRSLMGSGTPSDILLADAFLGEL
jgi:hypothetical protein